MSLAKYLPLLADDAAFCAQHYEATGYDIRPREIRIHGDVRRLFQSFIRRDGQATIEEAATFVNAIRICHEGSLDPVWANRLKARDGDKSMGFEGRVRREVIAFFERVMAKPELPKCPPSESGSSMSWERLEEWMWRFTRTNPGVVNASHRDGLNLPGKQWPASTVVRKIYDETAPKRAKKIHVSTRAAPIEVLSSPPKPLPQPKARLSLDGKGGITFEKPSERKSPVKKVESQKQPQLKDQQQVDRQGTEFTSKPLPQPKARLSLDGKGGITFEKASERKSPVKKVEGQKQPQLKDQQQVYRQGTELGAEGEKVIGRMSDVRGKVTAETQSGETSRPIKEVPKHPPSITAQRPGQDAGDKLGKRISLDGRGKLSVEKQDGKERLTKDDERPDKQKLSHPSAKHVEEDAMEVDSGMSLDREGGIAGGMDIKGQSSIKHVEKPPLLKKQQDKAGKGEATKEDTMEVDFDDTMEAFLQSLILPSNEATLLKAYDKVTTYATPCLSPMINTSDSCWMIAPLNLLLRIPAFWDLIKAHDHCSGCAWCVLYQIAKKLSRNTTEPKYLKDLFQELRLLTMKNELAVASQETKQDAQSFVTCLLDLLKGDSSVVLDSDVARIFGGNIVKIRKCGTCPDESQLEYFTSLLLPVMDNTGPIAVPITTLHGSLRCYFALSKPEGAECERCKGGLEFETSVSTLPDYLTIVLMRYGGLNHTVRWPVQMDMSDYSNDQRASTDYYQFIGLIWHIDAPGLPAHYITALVNSTGWIWLNDDNVRYMTDSAVPPANGREYMLLYQKQPREKPQPTAEEATFAKMRAAGLSEQEIFDWNVKMQVLLKRPHDNSAGHAKQQRDDAIALSKMFNKL